jgi:hypothetical protein
MLFFEKSNILNLSALFTGPEDVIASMKTPTKKPPMTYKFKKPTECTDFLLWTFKNGYKSRKTVTIMPWTGPFLSILHHRNPRLWKV